ncbi:CoA ester lyase, partial [Burkholderia contaminans]
LTADARRARAFGFGGKLCIHPAQVAGVNDAMGYSEDEHAWARRVIDAAAKHGGAAFSLDGRMVDLPVIRAAQAIIAGTRK